MAHGNFGDAARDNLRTAVAAVERDLSQLPATADDHRPAESLRASWSELVKLLDLGPAPQTRQCPVCSGTGMRAASRCSYCWAKLEPLLPVTAEAPQAPQVQRDNA